LCRQGVENGRHAAEAVSVGDARPSELVHDPGFGRSLISSHRIEPKELELYDEKAMRLY
jgi:hypothetical protein